MLEGVDVDAAVVQGHVRGDVVGEVTTSTVQAVFSLATLAAVSTSSVGTTAMAPTFGVLFSSFCRNRQYQGCQQRSTLQDLLPNFAKTSCRNRRLTMITLF